MVGLELTLAADPAVCLVRPAEARLEVAGAVRALDQPAVAVRAVAA